MRGFLPVNKNDMVQRGWDSVDFVYVIGDAYVDHPSFGPAIISRVLESRGYKVGIISQPDWKNPDSVKEFGRPNLGFLVSSGNMDSMVNHYSVSRKRRSSDAFTPGGALGKRPDYAAVVYGNLIRQAYKDAVIILGGIEASLRRLAHYDYWSDTLKRSVLLDSSADIISYGMGEKSIVEIADALSSGLKAEDITFINGTVYKTKSIENIEGCLLLPSFRELKEERKKYAESFKIQYENTDHFSAKRLAENYGDIFVVQNPPAAPLTQYEMDEVYALPYMRDYHPVYEKAGGVPAFSEVKFSITSNRGCFGGCSFCALTFHQGRIIQTRSKQSIMREAEILIRDKDFKGYIHDVGGPTANFRHTACEKQLKKGVCVNKQCLFPKPCKNLLVDHREYLDILRSLRKLPGVKKVFVRSGIRFDYVMADKNDEFLNELCEHHISGQLKVAPEHISDRVLTLMGKPPNSVYNAFCAKYKAVNAKLGKKQYLVPYLMSSHPGSTLKDAIALAEYLRDAGYSPEQVQDFYPTPSTVSTVMYYTGFDPRDMKPVYVSVNPHEKAMQRALIQYKNPKNYSLVREALLKEKRFDLIGSGAKCLLRPKPVHASGGKRTDFSVKNKTDSEKYKERANKKNKYKKTYKSR